ncbi:MAG: hypothetical protein QM765_34350 [Myxococcales bacterium]
MADDLNPSSFRALLTSPLAGRLEELDVVGSSDKLGGWLGELGRLSVGPRFVLSAASCRIALERGRSGRWTEAKIHLPHPRFPPPVEDAVTALETLPSTALTKVTVTWEGRWNLESLVQELNRQELLTDQVLPRGA